MELAAKINLSAPDPEDTAANVSILFRRGDKVLSDSFQQAVGFADPLDTVAQTKVFIESVSRYTDSLDEAVASETRNRIVDYCIDQDKAGEPVKLDELSSHVNAEKPEALREYFVGNEALAAQREFIPDRKQLRQFVRISGRNENVSLSFTSDCIGETVIFDKEAETLTLRQVPLAVKARILDLLRNKAQDHSN